MTADDVHVSILSKNVGSHLRNSINKARQSGNGHSGQGGHGKIKIRARKSNA